MRLFVLLGLVACGGVVTPLEYPVSEEEPAEACDPASPITRTTMLLGPSLELHHTSCDGTLIVDVSYGLGILVDSTWLFPTSTLLELSARETVRALPPIEDWVAIPNEVGALEVLMDGWLYGPHPPTYPNTFVDRGLNAGPVLERIAATFGEPLTPIFVIQPRTPRHDRPWMLAPFDDDADVFGPRVLRAYLGPGDPWLDGFATFLWQYIQMREGQLVMDDYLDSWLEDYTQHRQSLSGQPHRESALAARVKSVCMLPSLGLSETRTIQHRLPEREPLWLDERGVLDVRDCLAAVGVELAALRYEDATPEALLRVRSAPGDPPTVERGGSFFQSGDVIIEVNRRRVRRRGDVAWALRDVATGERFIIVVQRGGQEARTWARRPRVGERDALRFALIPVEVDEP